MGMTSAACVDAIVWKIGGVSFAHHVVDVFFVLNEVKDIGKGTWPRGDTKKMIWRKGSWERGRHGASFIYVYSTRTMRITWITGLLSSPWNIHLLLLISLSIKIHAFIAVMTRTTLYAITKTLLETLNVVKIHHNIKMFYQPLMSAGQQLSHEGWS